jgi:hypothetical protein
VLVEPSPKSHRYEKGRVPELRLVKLTDRSSVFQEKYAVGAVQVVETWSVKLSEPHKSTAFRVTA